MIGSHLGVIGAGYDLKRLSREIEHQRELGKVGQPFIGRTLANQAFIVEVLIDQFPGLVVEMQVAVKKAWKSS